MDTASQDENQGRKRKTHSKSRFGCGNCKIRSVKCDETKPTCRRCEASGFMCNYSGSAPTLQLAYAGVFRLDLSRRSSSSSLNSNGNGVSDGLVREASLWPQLRIPIVSPVDGSLGEYDLRLDDYGALDRFKNRTVDTLGTAEMKSWYFETISDLAKMNPYLIHMFLTASLLHDAHLAPPSSSSHRSSLAFHWYHGTALFKQLLARPSPSQTLTSSQRDALWVCASLLGAASFAHVDTLDPRSAWPLKHSEPTIDLDWLKMGYGKRAVWAITDPSRPESVFNRLFQQGMLDPPSDGRGPIDPDVLPPLFYSVFGLSPESSPDTNPFHIPACILSKLWHRRIDEHNVGHFLNFLRQVRVDYRTLLEQKDPRAILLLVYWHSMTCVYGIWWVRRRATVEGIAMCIYLEEHCADDLVMMELLQPPKATIAMAFQANYPGAKMDSLDVTHRGSDSEQMTE